MTQKRTDEREWAKPENWHGGPLGIYRSELDSRIIVPKRNRWMGWTINAGRPAGFWLLVLLLGAVAAALVARLLGNWES